MPTLNLGQVRPVYRGAWNSIDTYVAYDFVIYNGSAYLALKDVPANYEPPSQTEYWVLFGAKGEQGEQGVDGADGAPGERGPSPAYRWDGTFLSIQNPDGTFPDQGVNLQGPAVPLSNSVTSTSETDAASSKAVKTAYDRGTSGLEAAASAQTTADTALEAAASAQTTADSKVSNIGGHIISLYWNEELSSPIWRTDETDFELAVKVKSATYLSIGSSQTAYAPSGGEWFCIIFRTKKDIVSGEDFSTFIVGNSTCGFYSGGQHILSTGSGDMAVIFCLQTKR